MSFLENLATLTPSHMSTVGNRVVRMGDMAVVQSMWEPSSVRTGSDIGSYTVWPSRTTSLIWVVKITSLFYRYIGNNNAREYRIEDDSVSECLKIKTTRKTC